MRHDFTLLCTEVIELSDQNNVQIRCPITAIRLTPEVQPLGGSEKVCRAHAKS